MSQNDTTLYLILVGLDGILSHDPQSRERIFILNADLFNTPQALVTFMQMKALSALLPEDAPAQVKRFVRERPFVDSSETVQTVRILGQTAAKK